MAKLHAPAGATSFGHGGVVYAVVDGILEIPGGAPFVAAESHGFTAHEDSKSKPHVISDVPVSALPEVPPAAAEKTADASVSAESDEGKTAEETA